MTSSRQLMATPPHLEGQAIRSEAKICASVNFAFGSAADDICYSVQICVPTGTSLFTTSLWRQPQRCSLGGGVRKTCSSVNIAAFWPPPGGFSVTDKRRGPTYSDTRGPGTTSKPLPVMSKASSTVSKCLGMSPVPLPYWESPSGQILKGSNRAKVLRLYSSSGSNCALQ